MSELLDGAIGCKTDEDEVVCRYKKTPKKISWAGQTIEFKTPEEGKRWMQNFFALVLQGGSSPNAVSVLEWF